MQKIPITCIIYLIIYIYIYLLFASFSAAAEVVAK